MEFAQWVSLFGICLLGAMSPGASLAVISRITLSDGRSAGIQSALAHGLAAGIYGLLTVAGLALLITRSEWLFLFIQLTGAAYLMKLGLGALRSSNHTGDEETVEQRSSGQHPALQGFLIAFLNPKLAIFMLALFSQFLRPDAGIVEKSIMVATVGLTDALWYLLIVLMLSRPYFNDALQEHARMLDRVFGAVIILLATTVALRALYTLLSPAG